MVKAITCSHGQAYEIFTESIYGAVTGNCSFKSFLWNPKDEENSDDDSTKDAENEILPEIGINSMNYYPLEKGVFFTFVGSTKPYCSKFSRRRDVVGPFISITSRLKYIFLLYRPRRIKREFN